MTVLGFHASHEQVHPGALLEAVQHAEQAGFTAAMSSDHFSPWSERQGHSAFAWSWLGVQVHLFWAPTEDEALAIAHDQWRSNVFPPDFNWDVDHVKHFDAAAEHVPPEALRGPVLVSSDPAQHVAWLQGLIALGFDEVYLHHVGQQQRAWLDVFDEQVLPQLDVTVKAAA